MKKLIASGLILGLLVAGCGGPSEEEQKADAEAAQAAALAKEKAACEDQLGAFIESLNTLDSRLSVGLTYDQYYRELGSVQVDYDNINVDALPQTCNNEVGVPAEAAFRQYVKAGQVWTACPTGCDPVIQKLWAKSTALLDQSKSALGSYGESTNAPTSSSDSSAS